MFEQRNMLAAGLALLGAFSAGCAEPTGVEGEGELAAALAILSSDQYDVVELGTLGGDYAFAQAINDAGAVVGYSEVTAGSNLTHAFIWRAGTMQDLGTLGGTWSRAFGINNAGVVVGASQVAGDTHYRPVMWDRDGMVHDLGTLGGAYGGAFAINERGDIVGWSQTTGGEQHATLWHEGVATDLGTLGGAHSTARGINNRGQVVGHSRTDMSGFAEHAFLWNGRIMLDLGTLGGSESRAFEISENGYVTGWATVPDGFPHAVLWRRTAITDLALPPGERASWSEGGNNRGWAVGYTSVPSTGSQWAAIWTNGHRIDLDSHDWSNALDVNQVGQVVGYGGDAWPYQALLWSPADRR